MAISVLADRPLQVIKHETDDVLDVIICRFDSGIWTFVFKPDPGECYVITPQGREHEAYDPFDGVPPGIPESLWRGIEKYLESTYG